MNLSEALLRGIYAYGFEKPSAIQQRAILPCIKVRLGGICAYGFEKPSAIQQRAILPCIKGKTSIDQYKPVMTSSYTCRGYDVIAQAQSGTGKTRDTPVGSFAYLIPDASHLHILGYDVIAQAQSGTGKTRDTPQIQKVVMALGDYMGASCHACIGGTNVRAEVQKLQLEAPHVVVGTPGRVFDMLNRRYLSPKFIKMFVLDEADEMLSRGFKDQIYDIFQKLSGNTQVGGPQITPKSSPKLPEKVVLLSATMPLDVLE
ncbi:Eukaryotic initiation factor 4A-I, partial [Lonchura striata]